MTTPMYSKVDQAPPTGEKVEKFDIKPQITKNEDVVIGTLKSKYPFRKSIP